jgi:hypothetical protein
MKLKSGIATSSDENIEKVFDNILDYAKKKESCESLTILSFNRL